MVKQVIVKTHSQYVVRCLSEYVGIWRENGWKNASGTAVVNRVGVEKLDELCRDAEEEGRFRVRFWKVGKGENGEAVELAQKGFERYVNFMIVLDFIIWDHFAIEEELACVMR